LIGRKKIDKGRCNLYLDEEDVKHILLIGSESNKGGKEMFKGKMAEYEKGGSS
jgi:hypothetical protein